MALTLFDAVPVVFGPDGVHPRDEHRPIVPRTVIAEVLTNLLTKRTHNTA